MFCLLFSVLSVGADFVLPLWWALGATIPIYVLSLGGLSQRLVLRRRAAIAPSTKHALLDEDTEKFTPNTRFGRHCASSLVAEL